MAADANLGILALFEGDAPRAVVALRAARAAALEVGVPRHLPTIQAFLDLAEGRSVAMPSSGSAQDLRLFARLRGKSNLIERHAGSLSGAWAALWRRPHPAARKST